MIRSILAVLLCFYVVATARPATAGGDVTPVAKTHDMQPEPPMPEKIKQDDLKAAQMAEMLDMMRMLQQLDLMEDYEIVGENENEKSG